MGRNGSNTFSQMFYHPCGKERNAKYAERFTMWQNANLNCSNVFINRMTACYNELLAQLNLFIHSPIVLPPKRRARNCKSLLSSFRIMLAFVFERRVTTVYRFFYIFCLSKIHSNPKVALDSFALLEQFPADVSCTTNNYNTYYDKTQKLVGALRSISPTTRSIRSSKKNYRFQILVIPIHTVAF